MKKHLLAIIFSVVFVFTFLNPTLCASAIHIPGNDSKDVIYFPDGSYIITEIHEESTSFYTLEARQTKRGNKVRTAYSKDGEKLGSLTVYGTFTYNGTTATAESASYSHTVDASGWSFSGGSSYCSGATATASGTFKCLFESKTLTVSLRCSASGVLS